MRKIIFAMPVLCAVSCTGHLEIPNCPAVEKFTFTAGVPTKTAMADLQGSLINWSEGDSIILFDDVASCQGHCFLSSIEASDSTKASFSGEVCVGSTELYAVYPYSASSVMLGGSIRTSIPQTQAATNGSFARGALPSYAKFSRETPEAVFKNLGAVLSFDIPSYISDASAVTISSRSGAPISGNLTFDASDGSFVSVEGSSSVRLEGGFIPSGRYFAVIAPVTLTSGVDIVISSPTSGQYSRSTTRTITAAPGNIYHLGTLGVVPQFSSNVSIEHTTDMLGRLNGSTATFSVTGLSDAQDALIEAWDVELADGSGNTVRTLKDKSGTMSVAGSYTYIPQGSYTVTVNCTMKDGSVRKYVSSASSPAPTFTVSTTGYASYDCYKGTNGRSRSIDDANACDANTIYGLSTEVSISADIIKDSKYSSLYSYSLDNGYDTGIISGNIFSLGDKGGQSRGVHSFEANCTFDGVKVSSSRTIHVTGLPHIANPPSNQGINPWTKMEGSAEWGNEYVQCASKSQADYPRIGSPAFHIPADLNVKVSPKVVRGGWYSTLGTYYLRISLNSDDNIVKELKFSKGDVFETDFTAAMTPSLNTWRIQYRYAATGVNMQVYRFNIYYQ